MIARRNPLKRSSPEKIRAWQQRTRKRIPPISPKRRRAEAILHETVATIGRECIAPAKGAPGLCFGEIHGHHILTRKRGGSHDADNLAPLCAAHHRWVHTHDEEATKLGLLRASWDR